MSLSPSPQSLSNRISQLARERPNEAALTILSLKEPRCTATWKELDRAAWALGREIARWTLTEGDVAPAVAVSLPTSIEHIAAFIAVHRAGGCLFPVDPRMPDAERRRLFDLAQPVAMLGGAVSDGVPSVSIEELSELVAGRHPHKAFGRRQAGPWLAIASGGSTGKPKLIVHRGALAPGLESVLGFLGSVGVSGADRFLVGSPLYHSGGAIDALYGLYAGAHVVLMERFDAKLAIDAITEHGVNSMTLVPTMMKRMLEVPDVRERDYSNLHSICSAAAPCPAWLKQAWIDILGPDRVLEIYAGSEFVGLTSITGAEWLARPGSVGRPLFSELRILGPEGDQLLPGVTGEIFMRSTSGGSLFEYVGADPRRTDDGFYSIGDLGWVDDDGYLYLVERRTDLILSGGSNVYPSEVEAVLSEHPGVRDAAVIGLPDPEWGQRVHAIVETAAGSEVSEADLREFARARLTAYKVPKTIEFVSAVPRTETGKLLRRQLLDERTDIVMR